MGFKLFSDVRETSTTGGTGDQVLTGSAFDGSYKRFNDVYSNGDTFFYCMKQGSSREIGLGTRVTSGDKITRTQVYKSTNANALVNFTNGQTIDIFVTDIAPDDLDDTGRALRYSVAWGQYGADISSASTVNIESSTGDFINIIGSTTINAFTLSAGHERTLRFHTGNITLVHSSSLILPGGQNILTTAGSFAILRGYGGGVVQCVSYTPGAGNLGLDPQTLTTAQKAQVQSNIKVSGPTIQRFTSGTAATYTTPSNCTWIRIRMVGGGAGGSGAGTSGAGSGGAGSASTWSGGSLSAGGAAAGIQTSTTPNAGGTATGGNVANINGAGGQAAYNASNQQSPNGANSIFGGGGGGVLQQTNGAAAATNSGSGGAGGGVTLGVANGGAAAGGAGAYVEHIITSPSSTYTYTVGTGGAGGAAGTSGGNGGNGAAGLIIVEEYYN